MDQFDFAECVSQIDEKFIEEACPPEENQITVRKRKMPWALIAACLCLAVALPLLILSLKSNSTQPPATPSENISNEATALSLTVYHNSTEQGKSQPIDNHISMPAVDSQSSLVDVGMNSDGYSGWQTSSDGTRRYGYRNEGYSRVCCYENGVLLWESEQVESQIVGLTVLERGVAVHIRHHPNVDYGTDTDCFFQILDRNGKPLWEIKTSPEWKEEMAFVEHENGDLSAFIDVFELERSEETDELNFRTGLIYLRYNAEGEKIAECFTPRIGSTNRILDAKRTDNGFTLVLSYLENAVYDSYIVFLNEDGSLREYWRFENDTDDMLITNALQAGDKLYASGYLVHNEKAINYGTEIDALLDRSDLHDGMDFTEQTRTYYTAVLLEFDLASGKIITVYTTPGALGADVSLEKNGILCWQQENLGVMQFSNMVGQRRIEGTCQQINYYIEDDRISTQKQQIFTEFSRYIP